MENGTPLDTLVEVAEELDGVFGRFRREELAGPPISGDDDLDVVRNGFQCGNDQPNLVVDVARLVEPGSDVDFEQTPLDHLARIFRDHE